MLAIAQQSEQNGDLDRGTTSVARDATRTCALTREEKPVAQMLRFVVGPAGEVVPDIKRKLPGRGLWITADRSAVAEAVKRNVFARGFKRDVRVSGDLAGEIERLLERAALDALAIAGKAGLVIAGFAKVEAAVGRDDLVALIHAADGSPEGRRKLDAARQRNTGENALEIAVIDAFSGVQLDLALNRPNVVHAALLAGPGSETFLARAMRLARFRTGQSTDTGGTHAPTDGARGHSTE
jgi:predicted RNA-binding protein YlxR (DUF448 family)